ncbi:GlsB/YeaQ/YmgE family stress response membrane protein [Sphingoaurantiacus capsulatus]|uniref:GlsB/YeaQ/YmgE family stress response membrane protein n=1 Tax=Sphingoaurantiacus capsulatus TaxID=1771310 RepID=A0ABV7XBM8_9SPHN
MELLGWMIVGLVVGLLARLVAPRRAASGPVLLILIGIAGAMLAGFLGRALDLFEADEPVSYAAAAVGALVLILIYRLVLRARAS